MRTALKTPWVWAVIALVPAPAYAFFSAVTVPEPSAMTLLGLGLVGGVAAAYVRNRRKK